MKKEFYKKYQYFLNQKGLYDLSSFRYIKKHSISIDGLNYEQLIGCGRVFNCDGVLKEIISCVPTLKSDQDVAISIYEYVSALQLYKKLGQPCPSELSMEVLPMFYQKLYILENPTKDLLGYDQAFQQFILSEDNIYFRIALACQKELIDYYQNENQHPKKVAVKAKSLAKKHQGIVLADFR